MKFEIREWAIGPICVAVVACSSPDHGASEAGGAESHSHSGGVTSAGAETSSGGAMSSGGVASGGAAGATGASRGGAMGTGIVGAPGATVTCGVKTCKPPSSAIKVYACCMPDDSCGGAIPAGAAPGLEFGGAATSPCLTLDPGKSDASCKSYKSSFGVTLAGCCGIDHMCGVDLSVAGLGCNNVSAIASDAPAPVACGG